MFLGKNTPENDLFSFLSLYSEITLSEMKCTVVLKLTPHVLCVSKIIYTNKFWIIIIIKPN